MTLLQITIQSAEVHAATGSAPWLGPAIGFVGGTLTAIFSEWVRRRLFSPRLQLSFDNSRDCLPLTPALDDKGRQLLAQYVRVRVVNPSRWLLRSCRAYLTNIETISADGTAARTLFSDSIPLAWSVREGEQYSDNDIPSETPCYLDVCMSDDKQNVLLPTTRSWPFRYHEILRSNGVYRFTIQATGDGVQSTTLRLLVTWNGRWDSITVSVAP